MHLGDFPAALPLFERIVAINEAALGPGHPVLANSYRDVGAMYYVLGNMAAARPAYERSLAISEAVLGPEHPDVAHSLQNLFWLSMNEGDLAGAFSISERLADSRGQVQRTLASLTEGESHRYFARLRGRRNAALGVALAVGDDEAITKGRAADAGRGSLRYLDARAGGAASTRAQVAAVADPEKAYLEIVPREPWTRENGLVLEHELTQTFHGTLPAYTIVWDIQVPTESFEANGCFARNPTGCNEVPLYQLDRRNREDAELFLKLGTRHRSRHGFIGNVGSLLQRRGGLGGYADAIEPDRWHRVAIVVDLRRETGHASIYVDGRLVHETERIDYERYASVSEGDPDADVPVRDGFLLFADDDGEMNAPVRLASLLFVNRAYGADEVAALGTPGPEGIPAP